MGKFYLGKHKKLVDARTLKFEDYVPTKTLVKKITNLFTKKPTLPTAPTVFNGEDGISADSWTMMGNDTVGDCTCAAAGHLEMLWTKMGGAETIPTTAQILAAYEAISGYNPDNQNTDVGAACLTVLNYWKNTGIAGNKISAFVEVPITTEYIKDALYIFNGIYIGVDLPLSAESQLSNGKPWTVVSGNQGRAGGWGGHCVPIVAYDKTYLYCVTWGTIQAMTWGFLKKYCDEAYCAIDSSYFSNGKTIEGFNLTQLQTDLGLL